MYAAQRVPHDSDGMEKFTLRVLFCAVLAPLACHAQELEPRAFSPSPVGANFLILGYTHTDGGVVFDPASPITDVNAKLNGSAVGYGHTFGLFGRSASFAIAVPYAWGKLSGNVGETRQSITRSGLADSRLRFAINLIGGPALTPGEFVRREPKTTLGLSLSVVPPTGQYNSTKLVNIGTNRWAFKPEIGLSHPLGRWYLDGYVGMSFYTDNGNFRGSKQQKDPVLSLQGHVSYTVRPRMWIAFDATYYEGGRTTLDGVEANNKLENSRIGLTFSLPIGKHQSAKFTWSDGASTRFGADFSQFGVAWQYLWIK